MDANIASGETPPGVESDNSKNAENLCIECEENYLPKGHIGICDRCKDRKFWEQRNKEKQEERKRAEIQQSQQKATADDKKENAEKYVILVGDESEQKVLEYLDSPATEKDLDKLTIESDGEWDYCCVLTKDYEKGLIQHLSHEDVGGFHVVGEITGREISKEYILENIDIIAGGHKKEFLEYVEKYPRTETAFAYKDELKDNNPITQTKYPDIPIDIMINWVDQDNWMHYLNHACDWDMRGG